LKKTKDLLEKYATDLQLFREMMTKQLMKDREDYEELRAKEVLREMTKNTAVFKGEKKDCFLTWCQGITTVLSLWVTKRML
jgi:hypothetical protein